MILSFSSETGISLAELLLFLRDRMIVEVSYVVVKGTDRSATGPQAAENRQETSTGVLLCIARWLNNNYISNNCYCHSLPRTFQLSKLNSQIRRYHSVAKNGGKQKCNIMEHVSYTYLTLYLKYIYILGDFIDWKIHIQYVQSAVNADKISYDWKINNFGQNKTTRKWRVRPHCI